MTANTNTAELAQRIAELKRLTEDVKQWSNCNQAWLDSSEDMPAATVGHITEDGMTYPVATIDCDQYYEAQDSIKLARFYAAANPQAILSLIARIEELEYYVQLYKTGCERAEAAATEVIVEVAELKRKNAELRDVMQEVIRISDRKHDAWDRAKAALAQSNGQSEQQQNGGV